MSQCARNELADTAVNVGLRGADGGVGGTGKVGRGGG